MKLATEKLRAFAIVCKMKEFLGVSFSFPSVCKIRLKSPWNLVEISPAETHRSSVPGTGEELLPGCSPVNRYHAENKACSSVRSLF